MVWRSLKIIAETVVHVRLTDLDHRFKQHTISWQYPLINYLGTETEIESEFVEQDDQENLDPMQLCEVTFDQSGEQG